jgi:hypothetical protein
MVTENIKPRKLQFFTSFEAQQQAEIEETLNMSVHDRLKYTVDLIRRVYSVELANYQKPEKRKMFFVKTSLL